MSTSTQTDKQTSKKESTDVPENGMIEHYGQEPLPRHCCDSPSTCCFMTFAMPLMWCAACWDHCH